MGKMSHFKKTNLRVYFFSRGYQMFGVKTSFVATRSGLLRWIDHIQSSPDATAKEP